MNGDIITKTVLFAAGASFGAGVMYTIVDKSIKRKYRDIAEAEIESVKETWRLVSGDIKDPREELKAYNQRLDELDVYKKTVETHNYQTISDEVLPAKEDAVIAEVQEEITMEFTTPPRPEEGPYVITLQEFMEDDHEFEKSSVVYYQGDMTLVDDREEPIDNVQGIIGETSLNYFGYESSDPNVVHVRSPNLGMDFEVVRHEGTYSEEVLGLHADPGKLRDDG